MSETKQITSESVAFSRDIVEKIFSHLCVKDLRRAAGVCWYFNGDEFEWRVYVNVDVFVYVRRYWHEMAKKELSLRGSIESLILPLYITPYNHGFCLGVSDEVDGFFDCYNKIRPRSEKTENLDLADAAWHVSDAVRSVPKIFLVFCDDYAETEYPFCYEYMDSLPKSALFAEVAFLKVTVDGTELYAETNVGSGISIPSGSNLKCKMLNINKDDGYFDDDDFDDDWKNHLMSCTVREIMKNLNVLETTEEHSCFIFFLNRTDICGGHVNDDSVWTYEGYVNEFLKNLKKRFKPGTYSVLGTGCSFMSTSLNNNPWLDSNFTCFLRIYGSAFKSWSAVIRLDLPMEEMKNQLSDMKRKIHVNSSTIAICAVPVKEKNLRRGIYGIKNDGVVTYFDPTVMFKQIFPLVTLTCVYDNENYFQFGCNTLDNDCDPVFKHRNSMIFLFITSK